MNLRALGLAAIGGLCMAGCSADGTLQTASITKPEPIKTAAADPVCVALSNQIDMLRKDTAIEGLEKAGAGKGASVKVKREALSKQAELNRVNADYQTKCGPKIPAAQTAQAPAQAPATTAATATAAATTASAAQVAPVAAKAAAAAKP